VIYELNVFAPLQSKVAIPLIENGNQSSLLSDPPSSSDSPNRGTGGNFKIEMTLFLDYI
jgi:hypothetical protein